MLEHRHRIQASGGGVGEGAGGVDVGAVAGADDELDDDIAIGMIRAAKTTSTMIRTQQAFLLAFF